MRVTSTCNSKLICKRLVVLASDVTISGIQIEGSIVVRQAANVTISHCSITRADSGSGGAIVLTHALDVILDNVDIHDLVYAAGIFAEAATTFSITDSTISETGDRPFLNACEDSEVTMQRCNFGHSRTLGIVVLSSCTIDVSDSDLHDSGGHLISVTQSRFSLRNCQVHDCDVMAVFVNNCPEIMVADNDFKRIKSSGLSLSESTGSITNNHFEEIDGNGVFISDASNLTISGNVLTGTKYPALAILHGSTVRAIGNEISRIERAGICIREAQSAILDGNVISNCQECGVSVSDTVNCVLTKNRISECLVAGFEVYNESHAEASENEFIDAGKFGFVVFTGGVIVANANIVRNVSEAFVHFKAFGGGDFTDNEIVDCPSLMSGNTNAQLFLARNGPFESFTTASDRAEDGVVLRALPPDPTSGKCLHCGVNPRQGFFHPCGHRAFCNSCGRACKGTPDAACPLCRFPITEFTVAIDYGDDNVCTICSERPSDSIVLPCGHTGCSECLHAWRTQSNTCPICRTEGVHCRRILPDY
jgi:parallel beta-helix repeat protein